MMKMMNIKVRLLSILVFHALLYGCSSTATLGRRPSAAVVQGSNLATQKSIKLVRTDLRESNLRAAKGADHLRNADSNLNKLLSQ